MGGHASFHYHKPCELATMVAVTVVLAATTVTGIVLFSKSTSRETKTALFRFLFPSLLICIFSYVFKYVRYL